ncbi:MAG: glycosyltransferase [Candidatus Aenigmatarchaeota archaeon]
MKKRYASQIKSGKLKILLNKKNYGYAEGNNIGVSHTKEDYILFLNQDTYVDKDFLSILVNYVDKNKNVGICGAKILDYDNLKLIQSRERIRLFWVVASDFFAIPELIQDGKNGFLVKIPEKIKKFPFTKNPKKKMLFII